MNKTKKVPKVIVKRPKPIVTKISNDPSSKSHEELIKYYNHLSSPFSIFDNRIRKFIYCNNKFIKLTGLTEAECYTLKFDDFGKWIHPDDHYTLHHQIGIRLRELYSKNMNTLSLSLLQFNFQFNFRLKDQNKNGIHPSLLAQCSVIEWDESNKPGIVLILLSDISNYCTGNKIVFSINLNTGENQQWTNVLREEFLIRPQFLSRREYEVFTYILKDISASEISKLLKISFFTVRTHWRKILLKTKCKTQKELKQLAQKEGWV